MDEPKLLTEALNAVKTSQIQMKKCLDADELMDAFKSASSMLSELRTSSLGPKAYYELYISVFDSLRHLSSYLYDAHLSGKHHLADLYELVQYASNIIPRLYLMITVASVYMSTPDAPIKEIMKDILEMSRGVQHPIRGLFLRHYLSGQTRDYLPISVSDSGNGSLNDSIAFILTNFIEMNKLWVRLQHQGHSRDKERRELERKELRILVGTNLVRLSQLEEIDLATYQSLILPNILEQVVNCRDVIAQDYLMEVVIQVLPDEFQLSTLGPFLAAAAQLNTRVNIKQIVISLIDRLSMYAKRESEMQSTEEIAKQDQETNKKLEDKVKARRSGQEYVPDSPADKKGKGREEDPSKKYRGIPQSVKLFEVFWEQIVNLIETRPDLSIQDITALLVSLASLSLNCYPDKLEYVDQVLSFTKSKLDTIPQHSPQTISNILALLRAPISSYKSMITLLALPSYLPLMQLQPYQSRKYIAVDICNSLLNNATIIESPDDVRDILELCQVLIKEGSYEDEDIAIEQASLTRLLHLFRSDNKDVQFELLKTARDQLGEGKRRVQFTFPTLITSAIKLSKVLVNDDIFKFIHQSIFQLHVLTDNSDECMRLFLLATKKADEAKLKEVTYEFFSEALLLIEEDIISSKYQMQGIASGTKTLQNLSIFASNPDEYQILANKLVNMSAKLLKKSHQAESLIIASSVFWQAEGGIRDGSSIKVVLERASRIASTLIDPVTTTQIYVDILDAYLMYLDMEVEEISTSVVSDAVQLISGNLDTMEEANKHPISVALRAPSVVDVKLTSANVTSQFKRSIAHIHSKRNYTPKWNEIDVAGPSLRFGIN